MMFCLFVFCHLASSPGKFSLLSHYSHHQCTVRPFMSMERGGKFFRGQFNRDECVFCVTMWKRWKKYAKLHS